jgi:hypothetical protein
MPEYTRQQAQAMLIIERFRRKGAHGKHTSEIDTAPHPMKPGAPTPDAILWPVDYMYAAGHILVRDEYVERVRPIVRGLRRGFRAEPEATPVIRGLHRLTLPRGVRVHEALDAVKHGTRAKGGRHEGVGGSVAGPDHIVSLTGRKPTGNGAGGTCPASEPHPTASNATPFPAPVADATAGKGVRIVVLDTGIDSAAVQAHAWLHGVTGDPDPAVQNRDPLGTYAGHGTFIAGVVRIVAPAAELHVRADFKVGGVIRESDLVGALDDVLANDDPDIISLSAGVWSGDATGPLGFQVFYETRLRHHKGVALVAAAGNDASRRPFWPAASPWTVSVGSLNSEQTERAAFSNFGGWVDVYAPGEDLVNAFPTGTYCYTEPPDLGTLAHFAGMARWSGTSFSTPMVAGMIAARMSATGENGLCAAAALLDIAHNSAMHGVGAILKPS